MPIKGVSEVRRITRGGHLRFGEIQVSNGGKEYPSKIDYFRADFEDPENERIFHELYGDKPKKVTIAFAYETVDENFPQWYKFYGKSSGLRCKGDGERAVRMAENGDMVDVECPTPDFCKYCAGSNGKPQCGRHASLQFFIKGIPGLNVFQINTGSFNSIVNINSSIELMRGWRNGAPISGLWLDLELVPQFAQAEGKKVTIYTLRLNIKASLCEILEQRQDWRPPAALPAPLDVYDPLLQMEPDPFVSQEDDEQEEAPAPPTATLPASTKARAAKSEAPDWVDDDDVQDVLAGIPDKKRTVLLKSAVTNGWTRPEFLEVLRKQGYTKTEAAPAVVTPVPAAAKLGDRHPNDSF